MKTIFRYLKPFVPRMSLGLTIKFIGSVMDLLLPWILSYIIDEVAPTKDLPRVFLWGGAMVAAALLAWGTNILANRMAAWVAQHTTESIRHDLFAKISSLSCAQVDAFSIPSLESRLTTDTYQIHQMLGMMQRIGIRAPILLVGGVLITLTLDPVLTLVLVCTLPFIGVLVYSVSKKGVPLYVQLQQSVDAMVRTVRETISGIRVIKALSKVDYEKERFAGVNAGVSAKEAKAGITMALTNPLMNLFLNLGLTAVIVAGAYRVNAGLTQPGKIIAFLSYFTIILNAMMAMTRIFVSFSRSSASGGRCCAPSAFSSASSPRCWPPRRTWPLYPPPKRTPLTMWSLTTSPFPTTKPSPMWRTSASACALGRLWASLEPLAAASPLWSTCLCACMTRTRAKSPLEAGPSGPSPQRSCIPSLGWCFKTTLFSPTPFMRTSTSAGACPGRRLKKPPAAPRLWSSSPRCQRALNIG